MFTAHAAGRAVPVVVALAGDDGLTQSLSVALKKVLARDEDIKKSQSRHHEELLISSDTNVDSDNLKGREVIIYNVSFFRNGGAMGNLVGVCYANRPDDCAINIVSNFKRIVAIAGR
jgi:hypothetical protein